jgi:hypothetical protein
MAIIIDIAIILSLSITLDFAIASIVRISNFGIFLEFIDIIVLITIKILLYFFLTHILSLFGTCILFFAVLIHVDMLFLIDIRLIYSVLSASQLVYPTYQLSQICLTLCTKTLL